MKVRKNITHKQAGRSMHPDFICRSVTEIDFEYLRTKGIKACFIDLDGTVVSRGTFDVDPAIRQALKQADMPIYIATNRPVSRSLKTLKADLHAIGVVHPRGIYGKPSRHYYDNALQQLGLKPHHVVMVGDRYLQDIFGANRAGIYSLLVFKLGKSQNFLDTYLSRREKQRTESLFDAYEDSTTKDN